VKRTRGKSIATLDHDLRVLLDKLCVEWGFCIPPDHADRIASSDHLDGDGFASAVLRAEGMDPEYELHWFRRIRRRFVDEFGNSVSVSTYQGD
jgi:hypothetical protein